jgi:serine/threonine protein kinase
MSGYGKEADIWSIGVIMFLLLMGKLPFDGKDREEIIANTVRGELTFKNPQVWHNLSEDARDLILGLLNKSPAKRITAREALRHPWITKHAAIMPHHHHHHHGSHYRGSSLGSANGHHSPHARPAHHRGTPQAARTQPEIDHPATRAHTPPPMLVIDEGIETK